jgi:hypothetical protein
MKKRKLLFSRQLKYAVKRGHSFTLNKDLAIAIARETKKAPIEYIRPGNRETYLRAYPELSQKVE